MGVGGFGEPKLQDSISIILLLMKYVKRQDVKSQTVLQIEAQLPKTYLTTQGNAPRLIKYSPDEKDWFIWTRSGSQMYSYTLDTLGIQKMIDKAQQVRTKNLRNQGDLTVLIETQVCHRSLTMRQFSVLGQHYLSIISEQKGRATAFLKEDQAQIEEVKEEEKYFEQNKQEFIQNVKKAQDGFEDSGGSVNDVSRRSQDC